MACRWERLYGGGTLGAAYPAIVARYHAALVTEATVCQRRRQGKGRTARLLYSVPSEERGRED